MAVLDSRKNQQDMCKEKDEKDFIQGIGSYNYGDQTLPVQGLCDGEM